MPHRSPVRFAALLLLLALGISTAGGALPARPSAPDDAAAPIPEPDPNLPVSITAAAADPVPLAQARAGMELNLAPIRSQPFGQAARVRGDGVTIAIIDTGVDPGHPDLRLTPDGQPKIVDWQDFTREGLVRTELPAVIRNGQAEVTVDPARGQKAYYRTGAIPSASGQAWFGYLRESAIRRAGQAGHDLDRNGSFTDVYPVLVVDSEQPYRYDRVYVDTNRNGDFSGETPLRVYRTAPQPPAWFGFDKPGTPVEDRTAFVLTEIAPDGKSVTLGFAGHWHGTHVASVAAAWSPDGLQGVAPGARIMALKALNSDGTGIWLHISQALQYAVAQGADIINLSIDNLGRDVGESQVMQALGALVAQHKVLVVLAAGNRGPGLSSATAVGDPALVLTVGGYYSPDMWQRDNGYPLPAEMVWDQSGAGPRQDGGMTPLLIAPAGAPGAVPRWLTGSGYALARGTSQAAPHVSGAAALLMEAARRTGISTDFRVIKGALEQGARPVEGFHPFEQGFGLLNAEGAWNYLRRAGSPPVVTATEAAGKGQGLLARDRMVGSTTFSLQTTGPETKVNVVSAVSWIRPERESLTLPANARRTLRVDYLPPDAPGIYSEFLTLVGPGYEVKVPHTLLVPHEIPAGGELNLDGAGLLAGRPDRAFFRVPPGTGQFEVRVAVPADPRSNLPRGRIKFLLFDPSGRQAYRSTLMGRGPESLIQNVSFLIDNPREGVWELLVLSDPLMAQLSPQQPVSDYQVRVRSRSLAAVPAQQFAQGFAPSGGPVRFSYPRGGITVREHVVVQSNFGGITAVVAAAGLTPKPEGNEITRLDYSGQILEPGISVQQAVPLARFEVQAQQPAQHKMGLKLMRLNPETNQYEPYRVQLLEPQTARVLEVNDLPPGTYYVAVETAPGGGPRTYFYRRTFFREGQDLYSLDTPAVRAEGERWVVPLEMDLPAQPGRYWGQILLRDANGGQVLGWLPVEVSVGELPPAVRPFVPNLVVGEPGAFTLEVTDPAGRPLNGAVTVNGLSYRVDSGRVTVPVLAPAERFTVAVETNLTGFAPVRQVYTLWATPARATIPVAPVPEQERPAWRQKVLSELQASSP